MTKLMKGLFEKFIGGAKENQDRIHPDFCVVEDTWSFNRIPAPIDEGYEGPAIDECDKRRIKTRFAFNDPRLLDGCGFHAKVGLNLDKSLPFKYIGFAYGTTRRKEELEKWSRGFPYSEILIGLNREWAQNKDSERIVLSGNATEK